MMQKLNRVIHDEGGMTMAQEAIREGTIIRDLGNGLVLRHATEADTEELAAFNGLVHRGPDTDEPDNSVIIWTRDLMRGNHPTFPVHDFLVVEDTQTGALVSTTNLISQVWSYGGVPFKVGRPELVATHPDYRNRGLVRAQFDVLHGWSADRGELAQAITGIPYYYRQFGYEMTLALPSRRVGYLAHIPKLKEGEPEPYHVRPATDDDLPFIEELYNRAMKRYLVSALRDAPLWKYELDGRSHRSVEHKELRIITTPEGEPVGFVMHNDTVWGPTLSINMYELKPGASWVAVTPSLLRYFEKVGKEYAEREKKADFGAFMFSLGDEHPVYDAIPSKLPRKPPGYTYFMRVPDMPAFLLHIAPVLEERLAASSLAGHTGEIKLNFYRSNVKLSFAEGKLTDAAPYAPSHQEDGDAFFPNLTFLHMLFGHLNLDDLTRVFSDCWFKGDEGRLAVTALFPRQDSFVLPIG
jgi:hypothetical protein